MTSSGNILTEAERIIPSPVPDSEIELQGETVIVRDTATRKIFELARNLARSTLPVLVQGETGVGKELVAIALHQWSTRADGPWVSINCAAMPENLLESELFGHEKGAYTGAHARRKGLFEAASRGTLFLDEISEAPMRIQAGLLRALETKRIRPVGSTETITVDVRIVAATNQNLKSMTTHGTFRKDLYFRLCAATLEIPPLSRRIGDLSEMARLFMQQACDRLAVPRKAISDDAMALLHQYDWPGNVRELKNLMSCLAATVSDPAIRAEHLPSCLNPEKLSESKAHPLRRRSFPRLRDEIEALEKTRITEALEAADGVKTAAAQLIQMPLRTMIHKISRYGIPCHCGRGTSSDRGRGSSR